MHKLRMMLLSLFALVLLLESNFALAFPLGLTGGSTAFVYPLMSPRVSSGYGKRKHPIFKVSRHHHGIDLAAPAGTPVRAIQGGIVIFADPYEGYGNFITIKHTNGMTSHYGHLEKFKIKPGQRIKSGQIIATVGSTGISTGPHLHFEIRLNGEVQDPERFIPGLALQAEG